MVFKNLTSKISDETLKRQEKEYILMIKYNIHPGYFFDINNKYNEKYKYYAELESRAIEYIEEQLEIPPELAQELTDTIDEREDWHKYCETH